MAPPFSAEAAAPPQSPSQPPRLLDQIRQVAGARGYSPPAAERFADWARRFILFHNKQHPLQLNTPDLGRFLEHLAATERNPLPLLPEARDALLFLYRDVLCRLMDDVPLPPPPRLLDQVRQVLRVRHYALRTEECYVNWMARFILFHHKRHPRLMGAAEVEQFLTHLAVKGHVAASTQNQALNALVFLYTQVLGIELGRLDAVRARRPKRLPVVLSPEEVRLVLEGVQGAEGAYRLLADLLYGSGLRQMEACRLRVKDVDGARDQIIVRQGKGDKDRVVMLPRSVRPALERQLEWRRRLHERDLDRGVARVELPDAFARKCPRAARDFGWQFLFASRHLYRTPSSSSRYAVILMTLT